VSNALAQPQFVKFDVRELLRTDVETQAKVYIQYVAGNAALCAKLHQVLGR